MRSAAPSDLRVCISGFQLKFSDGLPHALLDPHARNVEQREGVVHRFDGDVERLSHLGRTIFSCQPSKEH